MADPILAAIRTAFAEVIDQKLPGIVAAVIAQHQPPPPKTGGMLTRREAAERLSITEAHLDNTIKAGLIKVTKIGAAIRIASAEVDRVIAEGVPVPEKKRVPGRPPGRPRKQPQPAA